MTISYPARVSLARLPTPLEPLERLSREIGGPRLWVKRDDLTGVGVSGNKVRKLEFSVGEALAQECDTLITCGALQSNHCRATAIVGARLGLQVHLFLRGLPQGAPDGNLFLDYLVGAKLSYYPPAEYYARREEIFAELVEKYARDGRKAFVIPAGASDEIGLWGYLTACEELKADCKRHGFAPDYIICATGSGGTQTGLIAGNALHQLGATIWGINVDDNDAATFKRKIRADLRAWKNRYQQHLDVDALSIEVIEGYVGPGYGKAEPPVFETITRVGRTEGIILDPVYTGKAFHGLIKEIESGRLADASNIVFIHSGGIFGLLAQHSELNFESVGSQ
ncbi:MAG: D-cysteine desulfhydrase family protein [Nitrospira sp.]|nr:D-cysteine desulfhydrase family protein [Nitrospira sp.]